MSISSRVLTSAALLVASAVMCTAQNIAPAHSGTVHYFDGDVTVDGAKLVSQVARFTELKEQGILHTGLGRAEILLTPGVLLRVGENSSVKMLDNRLISTRVEFLSGTAMLESVDAGSSVKDPAVTIIYKTFEAQAIRNGLFELKSEPSQLRVFKGEAKVVGNGTSVNVKDGNLLELSTTMALAKFDAKEGDDLYLWSRDRSAYLSAGNMASARTLAASGYGNYGNSFGYGNAMGYGSGLGYARAGWDPSMWNGFSGGWYYNSYLNMYSYLPFAGTMYSPFGYGFYNPVTIAYVYSPGSGYYWSGSGGAKTGATAGLPLSTLTPTGSGSKPSLPRLGVTATASPTLTSATRATQVGGVNSTVLAARNGGAFAGAQNGSTPLSVSNNSQGVSSSASVMQAAPAASAAPAMSAPRVSAPRR